MTDITLKTSAQLRRTYVRYDDITTENTFTLKQLVDYMELLGIDAIDCLVDHLQEAKASVLSSDANEYDVCWTGGNLDSGDYGITYDTTLDELKEMLNNE